MVAVGKAVGFVADALQELERAAVVGKLERLRAAGAIDFFEFFGQTDDGDFVEAELLQLAAGGAELALAAVDDDEVGEGSAEFGIRSAELRTEDDFAFILHSALRVPNSALLPVRVKRCGASALNVRAHQQPGDRLARQTPPGARPNMGAGPARSATTPG